MTCSSLWKQFEAGNGIGLKLVRWTIIFLGVACLLITGVMELAWPQQAVLGLLMVLLAIWMNRSSSSYLITLTLMMVSMYSTFRYGFWRFSTVGKFLVDPSSIWGALDAFFILVLCFAESYAFATLFLGYLQTMWPLRRTPVPLPDNPDDWPEIDLLIPTYNEPLHIVRYTVLASMNIDWPADKLNIYLLDDGKRAEFRAFAEEAGVGYMTRDDNLHAKAGNINRALKRLRAPLVAIFDCDHVPTRSFLQVTVGWFLRDQKLGMLQTPHHFYSPDPFERNLGQFRTIPNEGELFHGIVQDGNDFWNAALFCGSCAVLRKAALDEIGGIAVETVTEDAHTSLRLQMNGWNTAYINIPQAAGLATERLSGHVKQRIRWARGMIQIMRTDNPLFCRGLKLAQRLCYFNAMTHFLYALPRLIFLTAPLIYLILGRANVSGYWAAILAYAFPHLVLASIANSRIQGQHRHSFWNEIYETVLAPYIFFPTILALINPKLGSFNVTAKGGVVNDRFFDKQIAAPFTWMLIMNVIGLLCAIPRFLQFPGSESVFPLNVPASMYDGSHPGTIVMNLIWALFNMMVLSVATSVAWESQQRRTRVRVTMQVSAHVMLSGGTSISGITADVSSGGVMMETDVAMKVPVGESVRLVFPVLNGEASLPATIVHASGTQLRAQFDPLSISEEEALAQVLYSRADTWLGWGEAREPDRPLRSLGRIFSLSYRAFKQIGQSMLQRKPKPALHTSVVSSLLLTVAFLSAMAGCPTKSVAQTGYASARQPTRPVSAGEFDNVFTLADVGVPDTIVLRGVDAFHSTYFSVPQTQVVKSARLKLRYHFSPGLLPSISHLKVSMNGTLFATLPVTAQPDLDGVAGHMTAGEKRSEDSPNSVRRLNKTSTLQEASLPIPAEMLVHNNQITFEFVGHYTLQGEDPSNSTLWSQVDAKSSIELTGSLIPLHDDLKLLPLPFYDAAVNLHPVVPIVFLNQPSPKAIQAAGIVASWFGILASERAVRFPVTFGQIPAGNVIVIGGSASALPESPKLRSVGPTVAMCANPSDPYSKVLVITGDRDDDLITAARALSLQRNLWQGSQAHVTLSPLKKSEPDDAPRWMPTDRLTTLGQIAQNGDLQGDGSAPVSVSMRLPPDLYTERLGTVTFHMEYRYNGIPLAKESSLQVFMNGAYVSSTPMPHSDRASAKLSTDIPIPVVNLRPYNQSMRMKFFFQIAKKDERQDASSVNLQGAILKSSYLDIRDIPRAAVLPNLELFSNAGYPFTRLKDLSETAVIMPEAPGADEIELFLTMMGHFGAQTGYPVTDVTVTNAEGMKTDKAKDYLVLGTAEDQPALTTLNKSLPVQIQSNGLHVEDTQGFFNPLQRAWWRVRSSDHVKTGQLDTAGGLPDALIEGMEWPKGSNRSVVVIALRDQTVVSTFLNTFLRVATTSDIAQSVSVLHGTQFASYRLGDDVYRVGYLSLWFRMKMLFSEFPALVVVMVMGTCFLLAALLRVALRRMAAVRLQGN